MFKLLTEEQSTKVKQEYRLRRAIVILLLFACNLIIFIVFLFPVFIISFSKQTEANNLIKTLNLSPSVKDGQNLQAWLINLNQELSAISPDKDMDKPYETFVKALDSRVSGIRITGLSYKKVNQIPTLFVTGLASDRQTLLEFENKLNLSKQFSGVTIPSSTFAKDKNLDFEISMIPLKQ